MDPIADMLTQIRNAQAVGEKKIRLPASKRKAAILAVLKEEGYIEDFTTLTNGSKADIHVTLSYFQGRPVIAKIKRVSRPGLRIYKRSDAMPVILGGMGIAIVTTPNGIMTAKTARAQNVGGEILCVVE